MFSKNVFKAVALLLTFVFVFSVADSAEARRRRRHKRAKKRAVINEPDLYQRMGGNKTVTELVNQWVTSAMGDGRLAGAFGSNDPKPAAVTKIKRDLTTEICELSDGPCKLADPKKLPETFGMSDDKFVVFADHLVRSMDSLKIREREKNELLGRIGEIRVEGPADASAEADDDETATD